MNPGTDTIHCFADRTQLVRRRHPGQSRVGRRHQEVETGSNSNTESINSKIFTLFSKVSEH